MKDVCRSKGILLTPSSAHSPEQNGRAARKNRTLVEMTRAMLLDSGLDKKYWGDALLHANYLRNRAPTRSNGGEVTPFEFISGPKPDLSRIMPFGTVCFLHMSIRKKLDNKAVKCFYLGNTHNGYSVIETETGTRHKSAHVTFAPSGLIGEGHEDSDTDSENEKEESPKANNNQKDAPVIQEGAQEEAEETFFEPE